MIIPDECFGINGYLLLRFHLSQLRPIEVPGNPEVIQCNNRQQLLPCLTSWPASTGLGTYDAADLSDDPCVPEVELCKPFQLEGGDLKSHEHLWRR